ncbi:hypothetical protein JCM5353_005583 [Sporobolomyces roseus]
MRNVNFDQAVAWSYAKIPSASLSPLSADSRNAQSTPDLETFRTCTQIPSQIHQELLAARLIPDPFLKRNEELVQWVGEEDWIYRCSFELDTMPKEGEQADLNFDGLDTFATVSLNDTKILEADNIVDVTSLLKSGKNTLELAFHSAFRRGRQLEEEQLGKGKHSPAWNGDASRLFVRKAQYNYGWDWGPVLMTAGPWKSIRLEIYTARIYDFWPRATVDADLIPFVRVHYQVSDASPSLGLNVTLLDSSGSNIAKTSLGTNSTDEVHEWKFEKGEVELWWPTKMGKQSLYSIKVELVDTKLGVVLDTVKRKIAFRRLEIVQSPLKNEPGTSFCFVINNVPFFAGGSNWIPLDSFLSNATEERYRNWLELLIEGNQNMIRVWGGGIYEDDKFYDICDELGILVWQDFAFACGAYPAYPAFLESVKKEALANVRRLRSHPSLAIFAGNNEDYQIAESEKLEYDPDDHDGDWTKTNFPAREIYERLLPAIVGENSDTFYWPGSPFGGVTTRDTTVGDLHQWDVWHGAQAPYQDYDKLSGRFVSEFGMEAAPDPRTIDYFLDGETKEAYPQSRTMDAHNKAGGHERRLASYIAENLRTDNSLDGYIYATQFIQAEALSTAFSSWRRLFRGGVEEAYCAGALVWQLNDVWPCTSWSIVDYFLRPKPAYFAIKRALAPISLGSKRYTERHYPDPYSAVEVIETSLIDIWVSNSLLRAKEGKLLVEAFEVTSGKKLLAREVDVKIEANRSTELEKIDLSPLGKSEGRPFIVSSKLVDGSGSVLSKTVSWPEPYKYLDFPDEKDVKLVVNCSPLEGTVTLEASRPVKGLVLYANDDSRFDDNFLDLIPNERVKVGVRGATTTTKISWTCCSTFA